MVPALELMRSRKFQGWIAAALAFGAIYLIARIPGLLDFAETDLLHGHSVFTVATLSLFLFVAAPHRGRNLAACLLHGVALGSSLWWLSHFLFHADLAARNDILLVILHALLLAVVIANLGGSSMVIAAIFRFWLRRDRDGSGPLQVLELVLSGRVSRADGDSLPDWIRRVLLAYYRLRRATGRDTVRSYAIEKAFHASLDETSLALRRALESRADTEVLDRSNEVAAAAAAELEMIGLLRRFDANLPDVPDWPSRLVKSWDMIRWAEWTVLKPAPDARARLLGAMIASPVISPWLSSAARAVLNRHTSTHLTGQIAQHIRPNANGEELFGILLLVEGLVDADLVTWANDLLEQQSNLQTPAWFTPALARIRMQAEAQMLRHENALGPEETAVRRATYSSFLLQSDPPTLSAETRAALAPPLRELPVFPNHRSTRPLPTLRRRGLDLGAGTSPFAAMMASCLIVLAVIFVFFRPIGPAMKTLKQLNGTVRPAARPIAAVDALPDGSALLMATRGDGLHRLDAATFRLRAHRPDNGGPGSAWLSDVAVSSAGQMGVVTYIPPGEGSGFVSTGAEIETASGWIPLIRPTGIRAPDSSKITHLVRIGTDKLIREESRWLIYRTAVRELEEVVFSGFPEASGTDVVAASGRTNGSGHAFVVIRSRPEGGQALRDRIFELAAGKRGQGKATEITGTFPSSERVVQVAAGDERIWIRTEAKRLYEFQDGSWKLRLDADTGLEMERVSHAVLSAAPKPVLWLVEAAGDGTPIRIRARLLSEEGFLPKSPWRVCELRSQASPVQGQPTSDKLKLNASEAAPVPVFDSARNQPALLVAGRTGGLWRFFCNTDSPAEPSAAKLESDYIDTPGERLLSLDAGDAGVVAVLESGDGTTRRVAINRTGKLAEEGFKASTTIIESVLPDPDLLAGARILLAVNADTAKLLLLFLDSGRILTWDRQKHGFTNRSGTKPRDQSGSEIGRLVSADFRGGNVLLCESSGRVLILAASELTSANPRSVVVQEPRDVSPSSELSPLHVATSTNGPEVFFGKPGSTFGEPWRLGPVSSSADGKYGSALISWVKPDLKELLNVETLTRIQTKTGFENLVALGKSGRLFWRGEESWMPWPADEGPFDELINGIGATFVRGPSSLRRIETKAGSPILGPPLWESALAGLAMPVSALAGIDSGGRRLLVGHRGGLAIYRPETRTWQSVRIDNPAGQAGWTFLAKEDGTGCSKVVWAVDGYAAGKIESVHKVQGGTGMKIEIGAGSSVALAGDRLAIWDPSAGLRTEGIDGPAVGLIPRRIPDIGTVQLRRVTGTKLIYALDEKGRLLSANSEALGWKIEPLGMASQPIRDIEVDANDRLFVIDGKGRVLRRDLHGFTDMRFKSVGLQAVGAGVAAFNGTDGSLSLIDSAGKASRVAGGANPAAVVGADIKATLTHGDILFLAGDAGAVVREPSAAQMMPVRNSAGITRFDRVGDELLAYRHDEILRITKGDDAYGLERIASSTDTIMAGPDGQAWHLGKQDGLRPLIRSTIIRNQSGEKLFTQEGELTRQIRQAAAWKKDSVILGGNAGQLLHYRPAQRSLTNVSGVEQLPADWELLRSGDSLVVKSQGKGGSSSVYVVADAGGPKLVPIEPEALDVVQHGSKVAWIRKSDHSVQMIEGEAVQSVLTFPPASPPRSSSNGAVTQALLASEGTVWALSGKTAFQYSFSTQSVDRTVSSVDGLAYDNGSPVAITVAPEGVVIVNLDGMASASAEPSTGVGIGEAAVIRWRDMHSGRVIAQSASREIQYPKIPRRLDRRARSFVSIPGTTLLACLAEGGSLVTYDYAYARWTQVSDGDEGWTDLGLLGNTLVLLKQGGATTLGFLKADGKLSVPKRIEGRVWFTPSGWIQIGESNDGARQVVMSTPAGGADSLKQFPRTTRTFNGRKSGAFENPDLGSAILFLAGGDRAVPEVWVMRDLNTPALVSKLPDITEPESLQVIADSSGFLVRISNELYHVAIADGRAEKIGEDVVDFGLIGSRIYYLERKSEPNSAGYRLRRREDRSVAMELGIISHGGKEFQTTVASFAIHEGVPAVALQTKALEKDGQSTGPSQPLILVEKESNLVTVKTTGVIEGSAGAGKLKYRHGTQRGIDLSKRHLSEDGWFDDSYPVAIGEGSAESDQLPIRMRDERVIRIPLTSPASPIPYRYGAGPVALEGATLKDTTSGARLGTIESTEPYLGCDAWRGARPTSGKSFLTLDGLGQLWLWKLDPGGFRREFVPLPAGTAIDGLRLPTTNDGSIVLVDGRKRSVGIFTGGRFTPGLGLASIDSPAERSGSYRNLTWSKSEAADRFIMKLAARGDGGLEDVAIDFSSGGLSIDRPVGLAVLPIESDLWLKLGNTRDGRWIVCPSKSDGSKRIEACRLVTPPSASSRTAFSVGGFEFRPRGGGWEVYVSDTRIDVTRSGKLAIDDIRMASTLENGSLMTLLLATAQPGAFVAQTWRADGTIGQPVLIPAPVGVQELRTWRGEFLIRTGGDSWKALRNNNWVETLPDWIAATGAPSRWSYDPRGRRVTWAGEEVPTIVVDGGFALAADVFSPKTDSDGAPMLHAGADGGAIYQSASGDWFSWKANSVMGRKVAAARPPVFAPLKAGALSLPRRSPRQGSYAIGGSNGQSASLPLILNDGRMPHQDVTAIESWGPNGFRARLRDGRGSLIFSGGAVSGAGSPEFDGSNDESPQKITRYETHTFLALNSDLALHWQRNGGSFDLMLRSRDRAEESRLGQLSEEGLEIDIPASIRPVSMSDDEIGFVFQGAVWSRKPGSHLASFRRNSETPDTVHYGPVFDSASGRLRLGAVASDKAVMSSPWSGKFMSDGRRAVAESFELSVGGEETGTELVLRRREPQPITLRVVRGPSGWRMPFARPLAAFFARDRIGLLSEQGDAVGHFGPDGQLRRTNQLANNAIHIWRLGEGMKSVAPGGLQTDLTWDVNGAITEVAGTTETDGIEVTTDTFSLNRTPETGELKPVWKASGDQSWRETVDWRSEGMPGSWPHAAAVLGSEAMVISDREGIRRFDFGSNSIRPALANSVSSIPGALSRVLGSLDVSFTSLPSQVVRGENNEAGIGLQPTHAVREINSGKLYLARTTSTRHVELYFLNQTGRSVLSCSRGGLDFDSVTGLFDVGRNLWISSSAGLFSLAQPTFHPAENSSARFLLDRPDLRLGKEGDVPIIYSRGDSRTRLKISPGLPLYDDSSDPDQYDWIGSVSDWLVSRSPFGQLTIAREVDADYGKAVDVLTGKEIFSGNQMSFDHVRAIQRDPDKQEDLLMITDRAVERISRLGPVSSRVVDLNKPSFRPLPWRQSRNFNAADGTLRMDGQSLRFPKRADYENPKVFDLGGRTWLIDRNSVQWIEAADRWRVRREIDLGAKSN